MAVKSSGAIAPASRDSGRAEDLSELSRLPSFAGDSSARVEVRKARLSQAALANLEKGRRDEFIEARKEVLSDIDKDGDGILTPVELMLHRRESHFETKGDFARYLKENGFVSARWCTTLIRMSYAVPKSSDLNRGVAVISFERGTDTENRKARLADLKDQQQEPTNVLMNDENPKDKDEDGLGK